MTSPVTPRSEQDRHLIAESTRAIFGSMAEEPLFHVIQEKKRIIARVYGSTPDPTATEVLRISLGTLETLHDLRVQEEIRRLRSLPVPELIASLDDALMADAVHRQRVENLVDRGSEGNEQAYRVALDLCKDAALHGFHVVAWTMHALKATVARTMYAEEGSGLVDPSP